MSLENFRYQRTGISKKPPSLFRKHSYIKLMNSPKAKTTPYLCVYRSPLPSHQIPLPKDLLHHQNLSITHLSGIIHL